MSPVAAAGYPRAWRKPPFFRNRTLKWALVLGAALYLVLALASVEVNWARLSEGWLRAARLFAGFLTPDFVSRSGDIWQGLVESLTMTVTSTVAGILLSVPVALGAARNLAPMWL